MHVLLEMVKKDISIQQLPQIGPVLIPEMFRILTSDNVLNKSKGKRLELIFLLLGLFIQHKRKSR